MARDEYQRVLDKLRQLTLTVGARSFDLRWHKFLGGPVTYSADQQGRLVDVQWLVGSEDCPPFDPADRQAVGQLCMPLDDTGDRFTLGLDMVTIPRWGAAQELVVQGIGEQRESIIVADLFPALAAEAGVALPPELRDQLAQYISVLNPGRANWWYALLFAVSGLTATRRVDDSLVYEHELVIPDPLLLSLDLIDRLGLTTGSAGLPHDLLLVPGAADKASENRDITPQATPKTSESKGRRGRKRDLLTVQRANFAAPLRKKRSTWPQILEQYKKALSEKEKKQKYLNDAKVTEDKLRLAWKRVYGSKGGSDEPNCVPKVA